MVLEDMIKNRITELENEKRALVDEYNNLSQRGQSILLRINQIQGILEELRRLLNERQQSESGS